ncbi:structural maintenance of chromosomes protein 5 [Adelges cooleyi]|uniref:structural maintenance of chromosomes protein 5 n=1 Tax=Adelges cooleyi TaxID=133065 RepID=UPI00217FCBA8|nr:structural maintenance of chromosomes protein 5 [Adelges cooleyi]
MEKKNSIDGLVAKKRKLDQMVDGSIVKVYLKNFMTFNEAKYKAHPKLNLIIGPNGSGKSSIVTALILGFGGSPKDINRGDKVSQFVKLGKSAAEISIELYKKSNQNVNFKRKIFANGDSCHYYLNNIMITKKKYTEAVESFNINVHNLCQFLPQDRLEDFSKLDSKGLLLNALQSIEDQELLETLNKLKDLSSQMTNYEGNQKSLENTIKHETAANLKLETIVNSFQEKKTLESELLIILQKRCWTLYTLAYTQIRDERKKLPYAKDANNKALMLINKQQELIKKKKSKEFDLKKVVLQNANVVCKILEQVNKKVGATEIYVADMKELKKTCKKTSMKISDYREMVASMKQKLEDIKNETLNLEECKRKLIELNKKITEIDHSLSPIKSNYESIKSKLKNLTGKMYAIDQELEREKRKEDSKNELIRRKFPEMWKAITWLRNCDSNSIFHGKVFEPLFTQIEVIDQHNAKYIENIVNYRDMIAFVFEYAEDLTTFNKIVKQERWQKINSISAPPPNFHINDKPNHDINYLKQFGFHKYALDMIKAPPVIRRYLIKNYGLHNIPIGSKEVINNMQHIPNNIGLFFAGNDQISIRSSSYSGEKITRQSQISNDAQFLIFSVNTNLIQTLTQRKEEAKQECDYVEKEQVEVINKLKATEDSREPIYIKKKDIQRSVIKFQDRQKALDKMAKDLECTQNELKREEEKSTKFDAQNMLLINKYFSAMKDVNNLLDNYATSLKTLIASAFILNNSGTDMNAEYSVLKQLRQLYLSNQNNFEEYIKYLQKLDSEFKKTSEVALYWSRGVSMYDKELFSQMTDKFSTIEQCDLDDLDELIVEKKAKLNCLNIDPNAPQLIKEYRERKTKIKELEKRLKNLNADAQSQEQQIETLNTVWFPKLQQFVGLLNSTFQQFLVTFGCNGVIELDVGVTRYDFQAYGLLIKVQFRNDEGTSLRQLDAKSQSGGERALTTALFLLSLQEVTHFPFRIVDEINQGMDKVYERKLMELFMDLFDDRNNQYIVVTPKLIKDLSFKNTTVDIIFCIGKK